MPAPDLIARIDAALEEPLPDEDPELVERARRLRIVQENQAALDQLQRLAGAGG